MAKSSFFSGAPDPYTQIDPSQVASFRDQAAASATAAATAKDIAASAAAEAQVSAGEAASSASEALSHALTASGAAATASAASAEAAANATNASNSAAGAAASASVASTSATSASNSAAEAATSAAGALSSLNSFNSVYYGALPSDPTVDPLGSAPTTGDLYWNSPSGQLRVYNGASWVSYATASGASVAAQVALTPVGGVVSTNVQSAIQELDTMKANATAVSTTIATKLAKDQNLSDLPNKSAARSNLGLGSAALQSVGTGANAVVQLDSAGRLPAIDASQLTGIQAVPVGALVMLLGSVAPTGYLKANGALISRTTYSALWAYAQASGRVVTDAAWSGGDTGTFSSGDGSTTFRLPDLRGEFLRGWDDGRGVDSARTIASRQADEFRAHAHILPNANIAGARFGGGPYGPPYEATGQSTATSSAGGGETRPRNVSTLICIKF